jgi:hypothetical protein
MLLYLMAAAKWQIWEQRIGAWSARCQGCQQEAWQLTFRLWRTKGTPANPPTPWGPEMAGEAFQVRCSTCGVGAMVGHPYGWVREQAPGFVHENHYTPAVANPHYVQMAIPAFR